MSENSYLFDPFWLDEWVGSGDVTEFIKKGRNPARSRSLKQSVADGRNFAIFCTIVTQSSEAPPRRSGSSDRRDSAMSPSPLFWMTCSRSENDDCIWFMPVGRVAP